MGEKEEIQVKEKKSYRQHNPYWQQTLTVSDICEVRLKSICGMNWILRRLWFLQLHVLAWQTHLSFRHCCVVFKFRIHLQRIQAVSETHAEGLNLLTSKLLDSNNAWK